MFSVRSLTCQATSAIRRMQSSVSSRLSPSVASRALYCSVSEHLGSVRMRSNSSGVSALSSTRIGRRPCNSGIRSLGLARWKAPDAMNRIWSVRTMPYLVLTVEPSISGSRSRCTPSRDTSVPPVSERLATLSSSSIKTMPWFSTTSMACTLSSSSLTKRAASSSRSRRSASRTFSFCDFLRPLPPMRENICCSWLVISSMPGGAMISTPCGLALTSTSISLSSSSPSRSFLRKIWRVLESLSTCSPRALGSRASSTRSSAASSALCRTRAISFSRSSLIATSIRSRMMDSTSRPT